MFQNFYSSGRCDIINGNTMIKLTPEHRIYYCYFSDSEDGMDFQFDLLCDVGEIWKQEILDILAEYNIVTGHYESSDTGEYHDTWISYAGQDREWVEL